MWYANPFETVELIPEALALAMMMFRKEEEAEPLIQPSAESTKLHFLCVFLQF